MNYKSLLVNSLCLFLVLNLGHSVRALAQSAKGCPEMNVTVESFNTIDKLDNGSITIKYPDAQKYKVFLLSGNGKNHLEASKADLENLKKGDYNLIIQDPNGCSKHFKIKIE